MKYLPFKRKKSKKENFEPMQLPLYVEYLPPPLPSEKKEEEIERGVVIIEL